MRKNLWSERCYRDFVLRTDRRLEGSSGIRPMLHVLPDGSGETCGDRTDRSMAPEVRAGLTPRVRADRLRGEWNTIEITMRGYRLTVVLNGRTVVESAHLSGIPAVRRVALRHHGGMGRDAQMLESPSRVQFRDLCIREL